MLQIDQIHQYYGGSHILRGVSLQARAGEITVVLGRNGVGKTTLLKALMGLVPVRSGQIVFEGRPITQASPYERARAGIGYVPQGREIFARLTVHENLLMGQATQKAGTPMPAQLYELFPVLRQMLSRRGLPVPWHPVPGCWCSTNRPKASSPASSKTLAGCCGNWPEKGWMASPWRSCWSSSITTLPKNWPITTW
jgi:ABC-type sugar transport system ATPase subunit